MKKYKFYKVMFIIESIMLAFCVCLFCLSIVFDSEKETLIISSKSDAGNEVGIYEVGSAFLFGSSTVKVKYTSKGRTTEFTDRLCNDGAPIDDGGNCFITWEGETAVITLKGEEQADAVYRLNFSAYQES